MTLFKNPLIIHLLIVKCQLNYLESILDTNDSDEWPEGYYGEILLATDRFYRIRDKLVKISSEDSIDKILWMLYKNAGEC